MVVVVVVGLNLVLVPHDLLDGTDDLSTDVLGASLGCGGDWKLNYIDLYQCQSYQISRRLSKSFSFILIFKL